MGLAETKTMIRNRYQKGTTDTRFEAFLGDSINRVMEKICLYQNWWFLQKTATLNTVAGQFEYRVGCPDPATSCTAADSGTPGNPSGSYQYLITYVNSFGESEPSPRSPAVAVTTNQISLTAIPTADAAAIVTARRIYRNQDGGTVWYLVATLSDNTTTTYTDNVADASLTTALVYPHRIRAVPYMWHTGSGSNNPVTISFIKRSDFRNFVPDTDDQSSDPTHGISYGNQVLELYPVPDAVVSVTYPYFILWKRLVYDNDQLPPEVPSSLIYDGVDAEMAMYLNKENRWWQQATLRFNEGLDRLHDEHIRHTPKMRVVSEDEMIASWQSRWPDEAYYRDVD